MKNIRAKSTIVLLLAGMLLAPVSPIAQKKLDWATTFAQAVNDCKEGGEKIKLCTDMDVSKSSGDVSNFNITIENLKSGQDGGTFQLTYALYDEKFTSFDTEGKRLPRPDNITLIKPGENLPLDIKKTSQVISFGMDGLTPKEDYFLVVTLDQGSLIPGVGGVGVKFIPSYTIYNEISFTTGEEAGVFGDGTVDDNQTKTDGAGNGDIIGTCFSITGGIDVGNCVARLAYILWQASALIAQLAGKVLDFFVYYSTNSASYSNGFVEKGWGAVRDVANIFFIITLLYIAVKTVLGLNVTDNKRLISMIIIVALVINFSLFTTKVVIDASNILAKIFYNNISSVDDKDQTLGAGAGGEKQISAGLIRAYDPQQIISDTATYNSNKGTFIFITLLLISITLYTAFIFFSVALLFVARVISLWIAMIFSPIAFASHAFPFNIPSMGHKDWWKNLIENALLAPLFIFFLYIIVMFTGFLSEVVNYQDSASMGVWENMIQRLMHNVIPFLIIAGLLREAKKLAVKYSGEMGAMINKAGAAAGGLALGAVTGGAGLALGSTVGKLGAKIARNENWKDTAQQKGMAGWASRMALKTGNYASSATFDVRKSPVGSLIAKAGLDLNKSKVIGLGGEATKGGYKGIVKKKQEKIEKEFELYRTTKSNEEVEKMTDGKYRSAHALNEARKKKFTENIGKASLIHSLAYSSVKELGKEGLSDEAIESRVKKIKLIAGIAGAVLGGGVGGGAIVGALGGSSAIGFAGGATLTGIAGGSKLATDLGAESGAKKKFEKETKKESGQVEELEKVKARRVKLERIRDEVIAAAKAADKDYDDYVKDELVVAEQKLKSLEGIEAASRAERLRLESEDPVKHSVRISALQSQEQTAQGNSITWINKKAELTRAKDAQEKISQLKSREETLGGQLEHKSHGEKKEKDIPKPSAGHGGGDHGGGDHGAHDDHGSGGDHGGGHH